MIGFLIGVIFGMVIMLTLNTQQFNANLWFAPLSVALLALLVLVYPYLASKQTHHDGWWTPGKKDH